jgi:molybdopterin-guanine dinucleotide biosynthesis protein A
LTKVTGVVLAGGRARRMGGQDKGLVKLNGRPMIDYVITALRPQVDAVVINANRNRERYAQFGAPVIQDDRDGYLGPLAGMASALRELRSELALTVPCDSPFLPLQLYQRMSEALFDTDSDLAVATDGRRLQPVFLLLRLTLEDSMSRFLQSGERKIDLWFERHSIVEVDFSDTPEAFVNVNTPEELAAAEDKLGAAAAPRNQV